MTQTTLIGIDVSAWQGAIDWDKAAQVIDFAIVRLGYGKSTVDKYAARNISELERLGIPYGAYWYSYAYTVEMARNEARRVLAVMEELGARPSYPVYFDWEYDSRSYAQQQGVTVDSQLLQQMADAFCMELHNAGCYPGIYANPDYINNHYGADFIKAWDLWLAHYSHEGVGKAPLWQYTDAGEVEGIEGKVDCNICTVDYPAITAEMADRVAARPVFTMNMRQLSRGCSGEDVRAMQLLLAGRGFDCGKAGADGIFGPDTQSALQTFQTSRELDADGIAGPLTWPALLGGTA